MCGCVGVSHSISPLPPFLSLSLCLCVVSDILNQTCVAEIKL